MVSATCTNCSNFCLPPMKTKEDIVVRVGSSNVVVDSIRNVLSIPQKLIMLNMDINSGNVSNNTIDKMRDYLNRRGLHDVEISVNEYNPRRDWSRMISNPKTSTLAKCTVGVATCLMTTLACPKLTGFPGDHYNPMTNSVHVFSDDFALHECGHAEDYHSYSYPTLYTASKAIPVVGNGVTLYQEAQATTNAIKYLEETGDTEGLKNAYKALTPAYSTYVYYALSDFFTPPIQFMLLILGLGHAIGHDLASKVKEPPLKAEKIDPESPLQEILSKMPTPISANEAAPAA